VDVRGAAARVDYDKRMRFSLIGMGGCTVELAWVGHLDFDPPAFASWISVDHLFGRVHIKLNECVILGRPHINTRMRASLFLMFRIKAPMGRQAAPR